MSNIKSNDVFISYSSRNKIYADAICNFLEKDKIKCWYAPRDITPGKQWAGEIFRGIQSCKVFVLILSENSNKSDQVLREVNLAVDNKMHIITFIVENTNTSEDLKYYISTVHWIDAISDPLEKNLINLSKAILSLININNKITLDTPTAKDVNLQTGSKKIYNNYDLPQQNTDNSNFNEKPQINNDNTSEVSMCNQLMLTMEIARKLQKQVERRNESKPNKSITTSNTQKNITTKFEVKNGTLVKYNGTDECVEIPKNIVKIGTKAFAGCTTLREVVIHKNVIVIENRAFSDCNRLIKAVIYNDNIKIENCAFRQCHKVAMFCHEGSTAQQYAQAKYIKRHFEESGKISPIHKVKII